MPGFLHPSAGGAFQERSIIRYPFVPPQQIRAQPAAPADSIVRGSTGHVAVDNYNPISMLDKALYRGRAHRSAQPSQECCLLIIEPGYMTPLNYPGVIWQL